MSDATKRELQNNNNGEFEYPTDWLMEYSLQYQGCYSIRQVGGEGAGGAEEGGQSMVRMQHLVKYRVCPLGRCGKKCKGEYLIDANQYVEAYMENQLEEQEMACESARENCYCNDDVDDQACENSCFANAGLDFCIESDDDAVEFEAQEFMECRAMENQNNNNNYNNMFYVGMKCVKNNLYLDVFEDASCSVSAASGTYEKYNYGSSLPYAKQPLISSSCVSCDPNYSEANYYQGNNNNNYYNGGNDDTSTSSATSGSVAYEGTESAAKNNNEENEEENENNNRALAQDDDTSFSSSVWRNNNNNYEISEMCERTYEESAKCEKGLNIAYPRNQDCEFFNEIKSHAINAKKGGAPPFILFLFMVSTAGLAYMVYDLKMKATPKINLAAQGGEVA